MWKIIYSPDEQSLDFSLLQYFSNIEKKYKKIQQNRS